MLWGRIYIMKRPAVIKFFLAVLLIAAVGLWIAHHAAVQRVPVWDRYRLPRMEFRAQPTTAVIAAINAAVQTASGGAVNLAVILDPTPAPIQKVAPDDGLGREMDGLIEDFRRHERELVRKGASGYETTPYSGTVGGGIPLRCFAEELELLSSLEVRTGADAIHISRRPPQLECRAYRISDGMRRLMEQKRKANQLHVHAEPIVSAFATASGIHEWSIMVPNGPDGLVSEFRFDKVFCHLSARDVILAIATPEEHREAETQLRARGCWENLNGE